MSDSFASDDVVDITLRLGGLSISVSGPSSQAIQLVSEITAARSTLGSCRLPSERGSPTPSVAPFGFGAVGETGAEIEASFPVCPQRFLDSASSLGRGLVDRRQRVERAWKAGNWARAVLRGRAGSPNRTPQLSLQPRIYVVLRAEGLLLPKQQILLVRFGWLPRIFSVTFVPFRDGSQDLLCGAAGFELPTIQP